jgi:hypothetical protein
VALRATGPLTIGALANTIWSVSDNDTYGDNSNTFLQPFFSYTLPSATTLSLNAESNYNWSTDEWSVPINASVAQLVKVGGYPVQFSAGVRYWARRAGRRTRRLGPSSSDRPPLKWSAL